MSLKKHSFALSGGRNGTAERLSWLFIEAIRSPTGRRSTADYTSSARVSTNWMQSSSAGCIAKSTPSPTRLRVESVAGIPVPVLLPNPSYSYPATQPDGEALLHVLAAIFRHGLELSQTSTCPRSIAKEESDATGARKVSVELRISMSLPLSFPPLA